LDNKYSRNVDKIKIYPIQTNSKKYAFGHFYHSINITHLDNCNLILKKFLVVTQEGNVVNEKYKDKDTIATFFNDYIFLGFYDNSVYLCE